MKRLIRVPSRIGRAHLLVFSREGQSLWLGFWTDRCYLKFRSPGLRLGRWRLHVNRWLPPMLRIHRLTDSELVTARIMERWEPLLQFDARHIPLSWVDQLHKAEMRSIMAEERSR